MASRKSKSLIYNLCCSQKSLQKAFEAAERLNMSDDDLIYWFGQPPYRFAGSATYKQAQVQEEKIICSPYNEFGTYSKSLKWRQNLWRNKLPQEMRDVIPFEEVGPWRDVDSGIEFKFEEEGIVAYEMEKNETYQDNTLNNKPILKIGMDCLLSPSPTSLSTWESISSTETLSRKCLYKRP